MFLRILRFSVYYCRSTLVLSSGSERHHTAEWRCFRWDFLKDLHHYTVTQSSKGRGSTLSRFKDEEWPRKVWNGKRSVSPEPAYGS